MNQRIYLDNAATTPLLPEVIECITQTSKNIFGNPSAIYKEGAAAKSLIEESRKILSNFLETSPSQVFFTSCGTESSNMIIQAAVRNLNVKTIISSPIEHPCVLYSCKEYAQQGEIQLKYLSPDQFGRIDLNELEFILQQCEAPSLVSLIHTHNELGSITPIKSISEICKKYNAYYHSDTVQSIGSVPLNVTELDIDFATGSGHKFHGPKGIGFVYIKEPTLIKPFIYGGSQERNMRSGTENIIGIAAMAKALQITTESFEQKMNHLTLLNNYLKSGLNKNGISESFNTPEIEFNPKILSVNFPEQKGIEWLLLNLDINGISASGGSACSSGTEKSSHVLNYIRPNAKGKTVRFSFSQLNTIEELDRTIEILLKILKPNI
ncbi:MAG: cysteine desulfurase [Saprospiraceae bacterium]|nr:cysteine desulfurase [Saprospiraceae bacterium]